MTILEETNFYEQDEEKYNLSKNTEFLSFLENAKNNGYKCYISNDKLQELIDFLIIWFELKYPEREMQEEDGIYSVNYRNNESIAEHMTPLQLLYRLPHDQECLMKCNYRYNGAACFPVKRKKENEIYYKNRIYMKIKRLDYRSAPEIDSYIFITIDPSNGKVDFDFSLAEIIADKENKSPMLIDLNNPTIKIELLLKYLKNNKDLDLGEIEDCILNHEMDLLLREKILNLTALGILYSKRTTPQNGYRRAQKFIREINKDFGTNLTTYEIDEIMKKDYGTKKNYKGDKHLKDKTKVSIRKLVKSIWHNN